MNEKCNERFCRLPGDGVCVRSVIGRGGARRVTGLRSGPVGLVRLRRWRTLASAPGPATGHPRRLALGRLFARRRFRRQIFALPARHEEGTSPGHPLAHPPAQQPGGQGGQFTIHPFNSMFIMFMFIYSPPVTYGVTALYLAFN